jgi:hypothetical protein
MLVEPDARTGLSQDGCERRLPDLERLTAEIIAAKFDQVEGVEEHSLVDPVMPQAVETGDAGLLITSDASPSMMQEGERSRARASTISGNCRVRSLPGRRMGALWPSPHTESTVRLKIARGRENPACSIYRNW